MNLWADANIAYYNGMSAFRRQMEVVFLNLRQMEVFRAVMETGSITGAAKRLGISQPSATATLKHAEDQLGFQLFDRAPGRIVPTAAALMLFDEIENVFSRVGSVNRLIDGIRQSRVGKLHVVSIPALGARMVPTVAGRFLATSSDSNITVEIKSRRETLDLVASGAADLGFGHHFAEHIGVTREQIAAGPLICIMPPGHPLSLLSKIRIADLANWPFVAYAGKSLAPQIHNLFLEARVRPNVVIEVSLTQNAWAVVAAGAGISIVDPHSQLHRLFTNVVVRPLETEAEVYLEVIHRKGQKLSSLARRFLEGAYEQVNSESLQF